MGSGDKASYRRNQEAHANADGESSAATGKLAELVQRAQAGDHRAAAQLRRLQAKRRKQSGNVSFTDAEAGTITASPLASMGGGAANAVDVGATDNQEEREEREDASIEGAGFVQEGVGRIGEDIAEDHELSSAGVKVGAIARLALVPHLVSLLREHKFKEAIKCVVDSVGVEERFEILKLACERAGVSHGVLHLLEKAAHLGMIYDVLKLGLWDWTYGGIKAVQEAHERGDRDSRIGIYAWAWADCVLQGSHSNPGAVTEEQREAMQKGIEDGLATREVNPELGPLMIAQYGSESNARRALEDALLQKAGIGGVRTHA